MDPEFIFAIPIIAIIGGFAVALAGIWHKSKLRQLAYQERIAMIQRGMVPPPETHPSAMDDAWPHGVASGAVHDAMGVVHRATGGINHATGYYYPDQERGMKTISFGIVMIGIGFGLMMIISFAGGEPDAGLGVGGGIAMLGAAFIAAGMVDRRRRPALGFGPPPPLEARSGQDPAGPGPGSPA